MDAQEFGVHGGGQMFDERHSGFRSCGIPTCFLAYFCGRTTGPHMSPEKLDLLQGTLDLMVLQTLLAMGSLHGYGIARRIEQVSGNEVLLNQGTIYASLVRLEQRDWISAAAAASGNTHA